VLRLLQFQLSKFQLSSGYTETFSSRMREATAAHLLELYGELVAPVRDRLRAEHLVIVPHGFLHYLPFHAVFDGAHSLIDEFTISYAPSASVFRLCCSKQAQGEGALVMGVPDALTPYIADEIQAVAGVLPAARVFMGDEATADRLRTSGAASRFVHIATHGRFRRDNPMFSSIRLGSGPLRVFDLYELRLSADLVTLSGCSTGLNAIVGGDELLGLARGLLYAGASTVLLTLWDAYDMSTADFMKAFYGHLQSGASKAHALQAAMRALRERYPHPFYWAPFVLIGQP
jgi:CHAT domain-containing protein